MPAERLCPDRAELRALNRGELDSAALESLCEHLAACASCEAVLSALDETDDSIVANLRMFHSRQPWAKREEFQRVEAEAQSILLENMSPFALAGSTQKDSHATPRQVVPITRLGKYQLGEEIGRGGMGVVYAAVHTHLNRKVAVKVILPECYDDPQVRARFQREVAAIGELVHSNIVSATDADEAEGRHFLVMEFVDGFDLGKLLKLFGTLPLAEACEIIRQAAVGLQYLYEHNRVHRDLKPSNLMLSADGVVKILDLGLTRLFTDRRQGGDLTRSNLMMGTADYMAPEQREDSRGVDIRADIYSLGCTLHKILVGDVPFGPPDQQKLASLKSGAKAKSSSSPTLRRAVLAQLTGLLDRMLAKDPAQRFATPQELADALTPLAAGSDCRKLAVVAKQRAEAGGLEAEPATRSLRETAGYQSATPATRSGPKGGGFANWRPRKRWPFVAAGIVLIAGTTMAVMFGGGQQAKDDQTPPKQPVTPQPLIPGKWHDVLDHEPTKLFWQDPRLDHSLVYVKDRQQVHVDVPFVSMLAFGKTADAGYRIQLRMRQTVWTGGVGLFFGCHEDVVGVNRPCLKYQLLEVCQTKGGLILQRFWGTIEDGKQGKHLADGMAFANAPLDYPKDREDCMLEIEVRWQRGLTTVLWDGKPLPSLVTEKCNARFTQKDYVGDFGAYNSRSASVFLDARLKVFEEKTK
ncbi:MAG TPA: serine/threonine-protein kinase [Gemmataceae bacterium]|nr:serine/threonine-protein kinase [Gemmataceae bacterium]